MKDSIFVIQSLMDSDDSDDDEESSGGGEEPDEELFQIAKDNRITTASCASMLAGGVANIGQFTSERKLGASLLAPFGSSW